MRLRELFSSVVVKAVAEEEMAVKPVIDIQWDSLAARPFHADASTNSIHPQ
jgi:hypothetical protein